MHNFYDGGTMSGGVTFERGSLTGHGIVENTCQLAGAAVHALITEKLTGMFLWKTG